MTNTNTIQAYILAGGKSSRMGSEKGLVHLLGKPFVVHILETLKTLTPNIAILSNTDLYNHFGYPVYSDIIKEKGPLSGIHTGLVNSKHEFNLFVSCDVPLVNTDLLKFLVNSINSYNDTYIIEHNGTTEPLCGIYSKKSTEVIKELLYKNELSVHQALQHLSTELLDVSNHSFYTKNIFCNINSKVELKKLEGELLCAK